MSAAAKGKVLSAETRAKIAAAQLGTVRGPHSEETKAKIAAAHLGVKRGPRLKPRPPISEETRAKISASKKGKSPRRTYRMSDATREKLSLIMAQKVMDGTHKGGYKMAHKGQYKVINRAKYKGNPDNVIYRSSWEIKVMDRLDRDPNVVQWSSECEIIRYLDKTTGRTRRYIPDFYYKKRNPDGSHSEFIVEVKPGKESPKHAPPPVRRRGQRESAWLKECMTWGRNKCKWSACEAVCKQRGWKFVVLTERELGL